MAASAMLAANLYNRRRRFTEQETFELIEIYREKQCLWDYRIPEYKDRNKRYEAWEDIRERINFDNVDEVKRKIKSIRDTFTAERAKMKKSHKPGKYKGYVTKLLWYDLAASFILPGIGTTSNKSKRSTYEEEDSETQLSSSAFKIEEVSNDTNPLRRCYVDISDNGISTSYGNIESRKRPQLSSRGIVGIRNKAKVIDGERPAIRRRTATPASVAENYTRVNTGVPNNVESALKKLVELRKNTQLDEFHHFGQTIACQLRTLPKMEAMQVQMDILQLIATKRLESESDPLISSTARRSNVRSLNGYTIVGDSPEKQVTQVRIVNEDSNSNDDLLSDTIRFTSADSD